jgi:hypothetical protein
MTENAFNPFKPRRLKIVEPGWATYCGHFGTVLFEDGVSVDPVTWQEQARLGSLVRMESAEESESGSEVGPAVELLRGRDLTSDDARVQGSGSVVVVEGVERIATSLYSRQELEGIADKKGIAGLRDIATGWGVIGRSINQLIDNILNAQLQSDPAKPAEPASAESPEGERPGEAPEGEKQPENEG